MTAFRDSSDIKMKKVLFVCTGNTCRSPMAQAVFNDRAAKIGADIQADSCGLYADGSPVSHNAKSALNEIGIDFDYTSKPISEALLEQADYIFGITKNHGRAVISAFPKVSDKVFLFPTDISDPYGGSLDTYKACLSQICEGVDAIMAKLTENENG